MREEWDDWGIQEDLDDLSVDLDLELDVLPGKTANMMRLHRFTTWYTPRLGSDYKYVEEYERIIKSHNRYMVSEEALRRLNWRYGAMRAFNSRISVHHSQIEGSEQILWDHNTWIEEYPSRILPFDTDAYFFELLEGSKILVSLGYESDFSQKLKSWVAGRGMNLSSDYRRFGMTKMLLFDTIGLKIHADGSITPRSFEACGNDIVPV